MEQITFTFREREKLKKIGVETVILFGSRAQGLAHPRSDYDLAVLALPDSDRESVYDSVYEVASSKIKQLVDVDIVLMRDAPLELQSHVAKYGQVLFEVRPQTFLNFRQKVMEAYSDFAPLRSEFQQATLDRI